VYRVPPFYNKLS